MADFETIRSVSGARASQIDEGLRAHMNKVYGTMSVGMIITALAAWAISGLATTSDPALAVGQMQNGTMLTGLGATIYTSPLRWVIMFAPLLMIFGFGAVMRRSTAQAAQSAGEQIAHPCRPNSWKASRSPSIRPRRSRPRLRSLL